MTLPGRTRLLTTSLLAVALATTGLLATTSTTAEAGGGKGRPAVGECRTITASQATAKTNTTPPASCAKAHDDRVIAVTKLPPGVTWDQLSDRKILKTGIRECTPAFRATLGLNDKARDRSAYDFVFFQPTSAQVAAGARWLRCDLVLRHGTKLADLPTDRTPALTGLPLPSRVTRCLVGTNHLITTCTGRHGYRATGAFTVAAKVFPGRKALLRAGHANCPSRVSSAHYLFTWRPRLIWNLVHDHTVVCFTRTST